MQNDSIDGIKTASCIQTLYKKFENRKITIPNNDNSSQTEQPDEDKEDAGRKLE